jgi:hypothetical protein
MALTSGTKFPPGLLTESESRSVPPPLGRGSSIAPDARARLATYLLNDIGLFSRHVIGLPLYDYQLQPLRAIVDAVLNRQGGEFLLVFPRQSGKNEAVAHLLVYLLASCSATADRWSMGPSATGWGGHGGWLRLDTPGRGR